MDSYRYRKAACRLCGKDDYIMCRIGDKHVCVDCFQKRCKELEAKQPPPATRHLISAGGRLSA